MSFRSVGTARERWFVAEAEVVAALREYFLMKFDMKALARDCCAASQRGESEVDAVARHSQDGLSKAWPGPGAKAVAQRSVLRMMLKEQGERDVGVHTGMRLHHPALPAGGPDNTNTGVPRVFERLADSRHPRLSVSA